MYTIIIACRYITVLCTMVSIPLPRCHHPSVQGRLSTIDRKCPSLDQPETMPSRKTCVPWSELLYSPRQRGQTNLDYGAHMAITLIAHSSLTHQRACVLRLFPLSFFIQQIQPQNPPPHLPVCRRHLTCTLHIHPRNTFDSWNLICLFPLPSCDFSFNPCQPVC